MNYRKLSFGTQSASGSRCLERILTVSQTCRLQNCDAYQFLIESMPREICRNCRSVISPGNRNRNDNSLTHHTGRRERLPILCPCSFAFFRFATCTVAAQTGDHAVVQSKSLPRSTPEAEGVNLGGH